MDIANATLVEVLSELAAVAPRGPVGSLQDDRLRAALLLVTSHSPNSCETALRIGYVDGRWGGDGEDVETDPRRCEIGVPAADITLRELIEDIMRVPPQELRKWVPGPDCEQIAAALFAIRAILSAFEWCERDESPGMPPNTPAERARALARSHSSLMSYRETGEP